MPASVETVFVALIIAAPGLFILGWASFTLLAWVHHREATLPFERVASDELRLVRTGLDLTYGITPIAVSIGLQVFAWRANVTTSISVFVVAWAAAVAYTLLYYFALRPALAKFRISVREKTSPPVTGL